MTSRDDVIRGFRIDSLHGVGIGSLGCVGVACWAWLTLAYQGLPFRLPDAGELGWATWIGALIASVGVAAYGFATFGYFHGGATMLRVQGEIEKQELARK